MTFARVAASPDEIAATAGEPPTPLRIGDAGLDVSELRVALSSAGLGAFVVRAPATVLWLDSTAAALLGLDARDQPLEAFLAQVNADDRPRLRDKLSRVAGSEEPDAPLVEEIEWLPRKGTPRRIELRGRHVADAPGGDLRLAGTLRDVTEQRTLELERETRIEELARTVLFSERFTGIVAHALRNPLAAISLSVERSIRVADQGPLADFMHVALSSAGRMERMIGQLLDFSAARVGTGIALHVQAADLMTIARRLVAELGVTHPECAISIEGSGQTDGRWDTDRLAQVMSTVIGNAVDHGGGGRREIRIDGTSSEFVVVHVHNEGCVPPELLAMLFNPFRVTQHTRDRSRGLGLGLYVARQIAIAHGGDIDVVSTEAEGTTLHLTLPRTTSASRAQGGEVPDEMMALDRFARWTPASTVTAQLFGVVPLQDRAPRAYWLVFERYGALLDRLVKRRAYKESPEDVAAFSTELRAIADRLGELNAGARDLAELHARAIRLRTRGVPVVKSQALIAEGRLMSFETMGHLLSFYRRRAGFRAVGDTTE